MMKREIEQTLGNFQTFLEREELCERTVHQYLRGIGKLLQFGEATVDKDFMLSYKKYLIMTYRPASVNSYLISANKFFRWCGEDDLTVKINRIQRELNLENVITEEEYQKMLSFARRAKREKTAMIMRTLACTGFASANCAISRWKRWVQGKPVFSARGNIE